MASTASTTFETAYATADAEPAVSWKAILSGFLISLLAYWILCALGMGVGGLTLDSFSTEELKGLGIGAAIWLGISALISLFLGSLVAGRVSKLANWKDGACQGFVIAALFFGTMMLELGALAGLAGKGIGTAISGIGNVTTTIAKSPTLTGMVENSLGDLNLRSDPGAVMQGVTARLVRGDTQSARDYLARQSGLSSAEVDQRLNSLNATFQQQLQKLQNAAATTVATTGWIAFATMIIGAFCAALGSAIGAHMNSELLQYEPERPYGRRLQPSGAGATV